MTLKVIYLITLASLFITSTATQSVNNARHAKFAHQRADIPQTQIVGKPTLTKRDFSTTLALLEAAIESYRQEMGVSPHHGNYDHYHYHNRISQPQFNGYRFLESTIDPYPITHANTNNHKFVVMAGPVNKKTTIIDKVNSGTPVTLSKKEEVVEQEAFKEEEANEKEVEEHNPSEASSEQELSAEENTSEEEISEEEEEANTEMTFEVEGATKKTVAKNIEPAGIVPAAPPVTYNHFIVPAAPYYMPPASPNAAAYRLQRLNNYNQMLENADIEEDDAYDPEEDPDDVGDPPFVNGVPVNRKE